MIHSIKTLLETRVSAYRYDAERGLGDDEIAELVRLATLSPTAFNFQNWKFIAVRSPPAKARLVKVAHGQRQVLDAAVTFIVCGTLAAHEGLPQALQPSVDAGILGQSVLDAWVVAARNAHQDDPGLQRDEAIRSASLAAMTLMLAAAGLGLSSGAMSGFDPAGVAREFELSANDLPVMLVTVGYPAVGNWAQKLRKPVGEVMAFA